MANIKDLTGQRFGRLAVLERTGEHKGSCYLWRCRCDCGNEVLVRTYFLTHALRRSCGCLQEESRKYDLTGQRFGRLVALSPTDRKVRNCIIWECWCDCGKTAYVRSDHLARGITKSCGCLHVETAAKQAATGIWKGNLQDNTNVALIQSDKLYSSNSSGYRGVSWHKGRGAWVARITFQGRTYGLGYYSDIGKAVEARKEAELRYFGEYLESLKDEETPAE